MSNRSESGEGRKVPAPDSLRILLGKGIGLVVFVVLFGDVLLMFGYPTDVLVADCPTEIGLCGRPWLDFGQWLNLQLVLLVSGVLLALVILIPTQLYRKKHSSDGAADEGGVSQ